MSTTMAPVDKSRMSLYKKMTPATQAVAQEFETKLRKGVVGLVRIRYDMGAKVREVVDNEKEYGSGAVKQLAEYLNIDGGETMLYALMHFASAFTHEFVQEQSAIAMANGSYLTLNHWLNLMKLEDPKKQEKMLDRVRKDSLSAGELELEIKAGAGGATKHARQGGRKPKSPTSPIAGLQKTLQLSQQLVRWEDVATKKVFDVLNEISPDKVDDNLVDKAEKTLEMVTEAVEKTTEMQTSLTSTIERLKTVLEKKAEAAAEEYDEEEAAAKPKKKVASAPSANGKKKKKKKVAVAAE